VYQGTTFQNPMSESPYQGTALDDYLNSHGINPNDINRAAQLAADDCEDNSSLDGRLANLEKLLGTDSEEPPGKSEDLDSDLLSFEERMTRLDRMLGPPQHRSQPDEDDQYLLEFAEVDTGTWAKLNKVLSRAGFNSVPIQDNGLPDPIALLGEIRDMVSQFDRRGLVIEEFTIRDLSTHQQDSKIEAEILEAQQSNKRLQRRVNELENMDTLAKESKRDALKGNAFDHKQLVTQINQLQQKLQMSEHRVKAKEAVLERLQAKLESEASKNTKYKDKSRDLFKELNQRIPNPTSNNDQKLVGAIRSFEREREVMEQQVQSLKIQVEKQNSELQMRDNILNGSKVQDLAAREHEIQLKSKRFDEERSQASSIMNEHEELIAEKLSQVEERFLNACADIKGHQEQIENLKLELSSRPTMRDWKATQRQISKLETQLQAAIEAIEDVDIESARQNNIFVKKDNQRLNSREKVELLANRALREQHDRVKITDTAELIRRDKVSHRLGLSKLTTLPKSAAHSILLEICRILEIGDADLIVPAIQKMCFVIRSTPRMETFIQQVINFVGMHSPDATFNALNNKEALEKVMPQLRTWVEEKRYVNQMDRFKEDILEEISRTENFAGIESNQDILKCIRELVALEKSVIHNKESMNAFESHMQLNPEILSNRCMTHFQQLFNVKGVDGIFAKMNQIYVFVNEMKNCLQILRPTLGLPPNASVHAIISAVQFVLEERNITVNKEIGLVHDDTLPTWQDQTAP